MFLQLCLALALWEGSAAAAEKFLIVSDNNRGVSVIDLGSGNQTFLTLPFAGSPGGVVYDPATKRVMLYDNLSGRITASKLDGSDYETVTEIQDSDYGYRNKQCLKFDGQRNTLYYSTSYGKISSLDLDTGRRTQLSHVSATGQLALDRNKGVLYYSNKNQIFRLSVDGAESKSIFNVSSTENIIGLELNTAGDKLFLAGHHVDYVAKNHPRVAYYYQYSVNTGALTLLWQDRGGDAWPLNLALDDKNLYVLDDYTVGMLIAPLSNLGSPVTFKQKYNSGMRSHSVADIVLVNPSKECPAQFKMKEPVYFSLSDDILGGSAGHEVASIEIASGSICHLAGNQDALETFSASVSGSVCKIYLRAGKHLDSNKKSRYAFIARVSDDCQFPSSDSKNISIHVYPSRSCQTIPESSAPGTVALEVSIEYPAHLKPLSVKLREEKGWQFNRFTVGTPVTASTGNNTITTTAQVLLKSPADVEKPSSRIHGFAVDMGFCMEVTDTNDNDPVFSYPNATHGTTVQWTENTKGLLLQVQATDADSGRFGTDGLRYYTRYDPAGYISVDSKTGVVRVVKEMDRETLTDFVTVVIEARDNQGATPYKNGFGYLHLKLNDANDNAPAFSKSLYTAEFLEVVHVGRPVVTVSASDADNGANARLVFSLKSLNGSLPFGIDSTTGQITVTERLFGKSGTYHLQVIATDGGTPPLSSAATVVVKVQSITALSGRKRRNALSLMGHVGAST